MLNRKFIKSTKLDIASRYKKYLDNINKISYFKSPVSKEYENKVHKKNGPIRINDALFGHINNDYTLMETKLEGGSVTYNVDYLLNVLQGICSNPQRLNFYKNNNIIVKKKDLTPEEELANDNQDSTLKRKNILNKTIENLKIFKEFANQLNIAYIQGKNALRDRNKPNIFDINDKLPNIVKKISKAFSKQTFELLNKDKTVFMPGGWLDAKGGHALIYKLTKKGNSFKFVIINTGAGLDNHEYIEDIKKEK